MDHHAKGDGQVTDQVSSSSLNDTSTANISGCTQHKWLNAVACTATLAGIAALSKGAINFLRVGLTRHSAGYSDANCLVGLVWYGQFGVQLVNLTFSVYNLFPCLDNQETLNSDQLAVNKCVVNI